MTQRFKRINNTINAVSTVLELSIYLANHPFFFFQAEDGIRDLYVTGVQTCALPIFGQPYKDASGANVDTLVLVYRVTLPTYVPPNGGGGDGDAEAGEDRKSVV